MTIPNLISTLRIILVPIFVIYLLNDDPLSALVVFILAGLSDGADGLIARLFNQKSKLGTYLDPLADKILLVAAYLVLAAKDLVPPWLTTIVITRDVLILLGVLILFLNREDFKISPSILSKLTTCFQLGSVFLVLAQNYVPVFSQLIHILFLATGFLTIASGLHYIRSWFLMVGEESVED